MTLTIAIVGFFPFGNCKKNIRPLLLMQGGVKEVLICPSSRL
jgi:hypothetical protein